MRKLFALLALWAGMVSCHIDKLLKGENPPPSQAAPARVAFSSSLASARAGEPISPPVQVAVQDSSGRVTRRDTLVTLSLGANPSGDSLRGTKQVRSVNGVATFANLRLDKAASGYKLTAAAPQLDADTSAAFSVMPAPATELAFTVQPSATTQDSAITPPVRVTAYDSLGNVATNFTGPVRVALGTDASVSHDATLAGAPSPVTAVAGVATFSNLRINRSGVGYTLTAAFGSATPIATSATFNITPGPPPPPPPPTHLGFTQQPQNAVAGATIAPPVQVVALDAAEHVVQGFTGAITLGLGANPGSGTLSGGAPVNAVNGVATFANLSINRAGNGYTLRATASQLTAATSSPFNVTAPPNQPPVAAFTSSCTLLVCTFTSTSSDPDGTIASYAWTFGDGGTATTQNPSHPYTAGGTYTVTLTVTDNQSATGSVSHPVTVTAAPPPNQPPVAAFTSSCTLLVCNFTSTSTDPDGTIAGYRWTFGDGTAAATVANPSHTYTAGGTFTVTLTVTDNQNATGSVSHPVTVTAPPPPNQPPVAAFTSSCTQLTCNFTSTSSDPDGTIASYAWTFGDGGTATTQNPSHTYTVGGTFTVTLTVTDNQGATGNVSHTVTVTAPPPPNQPPVAAFTSSCTQLVCTFTSTSSDPDGTIASYAWTFGDGGTATTQNPSHTYTAGGTFTVTLTVTDNQNATGSVSHPVTVTTPPPPNQPPVAAFSSSCTQLTCNFTSTSSDPDGTIASYAWTFGDGGTASTQNPSHIYTAGGTFTVTLTVTDNQNATGSVSHPVTVTAPPPPNQPPVAAFTSSCTQLTCSFTSTSSDPDGTIASYAWTFGDGGTASTQNPSHPYTAGGTYTVTLTVTDNQNATGSVSHPVTVTAPPPPNQPPVAAFTSSCTQLVCTFTSTSSDPDGTIASYAWTFGDGGTATTQNPSHTYTVGGTFTVTLTVTDNQNATGSVSHTVTVTAPPPPNQPPVVTAGSDQSVLIGALFNLQGASFSDPNHDGPWTVTIDWGDGSSPATFTAAEGSISRSHSYGTLLPATYTLTVTVQDAHGATGSASKTVQVVL